MALTLIPAAKGELSIRCSSPPSPCQVCEQNGLSSFDILSSGQKDDQKNESREYRIKISVILNNTKIPHKAGCPLCRLILSRLPVSRLSQLQLEKKTANLLLREFSRPCLPGATVQEKRLSILASDRSCGCLRLVDHKSVSLNPEKRQVDFGQLRSWLTNCEDNHGEDCNLWAYASERYRLPIDIILIDVVDNRLVDAESDFRYIALSYVWGSVNMLAAVEANIAILKEPGSLGPETPLPTVIRDAIELVRKLGERYLWLDRLCITQDAKGKHRELAQMDIVYSHALLTIAAVDAKDADASLPGVQPESRLPVQRFEYVQDSLVISEPPPLQRFLKSCIYETRGWTFQERVFSRRIIFVSEQQMYFQCQKSIRSESHPQEKAPWSIREQVNKIRLRGSWKLDFLDYDSTQGKIPRQYWLAGLPVYQDLVEAYSNRKLTFTSDAISAFAGFNSVFEECCGGPLLSAIPTAALGVALLWIGCEGIRRRKEGDVVLFSSWSWVGWEGPVRYLSLMRLDLLKSPSGDSNLYSRLENARICATSFSSNRQQLQDVSQSNSPAVWVEQRSHHYEGCPAVDLLTFKAPTLALNLFELLEVKSRNKGVTFSIIVSRHEDTPCGVIFGISSADTLQNDCPSFELVLVSHDFNPTSRAQLRASYGASTPAMSDGKSGRAYHTLNILLVRNFGTYYERIAAGKMYSECWTLRGQEASSKDIVLA